MARKRRGRRRGRWSQHPDWHVYYRQANEEDAKQAEMEREIEEQDAQHQADLAERGSQLECRVAFVGNLPYSATAAQLQLFLEQRLQASTIPRMSGEALVVHVDLKMSKGFAFVGFASTECKEYLKLAAARIPGLLFLGRRMRVNDSKGRPHSKMARALLARSFQGVEAPDEKVACSGLQLCTHWPHQMTALLQLREADNVCIYIDGITRTLNVEFSPLASRYCTTLASLGYSLDGLIDDFFDSETETKYKAQLRFSDIMSRRGVELKKGPDDSMALVLTLRRPPHLYQMKPPNALQKMGLEPYDERDDRTWTRTSEQHGAQEAFGRCLVWHLPVRDGHSAALTRLVQLAHAARLCRTREVYLNTMDKLDPVFAAPVLAESPFGACAPAALQAPERARGEAAVRAPVRTVLRRVGVQDGRPGRRHRAERCPGGGARGRRRAGAARHGQPRPAALSRPARLRRRRAGAHLRRAALRDERLRLRLGRRQRRRRSSSSAQPGPRRPALWRRPAAVAHHGAARVCHAAARHRAAAGAGGPQPRAAALPRVRAPLPEGRVQVERGWGLNGAGMRGASS